MSAVQTPYDECFTRHAYLDLLLGVYFPRKLLYLHLLLQSTNNVGRQNAPARKKTRRARLIFETKCFNRVLLQHFLLQHTGSTNQAQRSIYLQALSPRSRLKGVFISNFWSRMAAHPRTNIVQLTTHMSSSGKIPTPDASVLFLTAIAIICN